MRAYLRFLGECVKWAWKPWNKGEPVMGILSGLLSPYFSWIPATLLFVFLLPFAPYQLWKKAKKCWEDEHSRVKELERERIPKFTIISVVDRGRREKWYNQSAEHLMWAELRIRNTSLTQTLHNVGVRVASYTVVEEHQEIPGSYLLMDSYNFADVRPSQVYWSRRDADPQVLALDIPPGTERASLVAFSNDSNGPPAYLNAPVLQRLSLGGKIEVEVSSPDSAAWKGAFYIECHPNYAKSIQEAVDGLSTKATFEFIPWERWAATHPITPLSTLASEGSGSQEAL